MNAALVAETASASASTDRVAGSVAGAHADQRIEAGTAGIPLFVIPYRGGDGFRASIRGQQLELADPDSEHGLAPTPDDLRTAALGSDVAWFARRYLRDHGVEDYVSISVWARTSDAPPRLGRFDVRVEISARAVASVEMLATALERRFAAQSTQPQFEVHAS
jgi:hypothetical protein